ncbi:hypothetical protein ABK040_006896 [Willaertia magna]
MIVEQKTIASLSLLRRKPFLLHWNVLPFLFIYPIASVFIQFYLLPSTYSSIHHTQEDTFGDYQIFYHLITFAPLILLQILTFLACYWNVHVKVFTQYYKVINEMNENVIVQVIPKKHKGFTELCPLKSIRDENGNVVHYFEYQKKLFFWDSQNKLFIKSKFPYQLLEKQNVTLQEWIKKCEKTGLNDKEIYSKRRLYGQNQFTIPIPKFMDLFIEHALAPFFVFQVFCVLLWCLDEYWYYSMFTLVMLFVFESTVVNQRLRNLKQIRQMATKPQFMHVYRNDKWIQISSVDLLPNDIVSVTNHAEEDQVTPCDILIINGRCVTNEALLTGESTPQRKEPIPIQELKERKKLDIRNIDKNHVISGGTVVLQHMTGSVNGKVSPDKGAIGIVLRTGFETSQGKLIRTILYATERVSANNLEALLFILFLLIFAIAASAYVLYEGLQHPDKSKYKLILNCILIITSVVPPELPMELSLAVNNSLLSLSAQGIFCTEPFRIPFAGKVNVCCFDKTGTLVSDKMTLKGIALSNENEDAHLLSTRPSDKSRMVIAGCHSLFDLNGKILGDPMEVSGIEGVGFELKQEISLSNTSKIKNIKILKSYPFQSEVKRMSTIVAVEDKNEGKTTKVLLKGAPEIVKQFFIDSDVKGALEIYDKTFQYFTQQGMRVIALGYKPLSSTVKFNELTREEVESDLIFAGFAAFQSDIKPRTKETIENLRNSSHRVLMITGDNSLTASHVARELQMISKPLLTLKYENNEFFWHGNEISGCSKDVDEVFDHTKLLQLSKEYDFCVGGDLLSAVTNNENGKSILDAITNTVSIFARTSPEQKESIVTSLKSQNYQTLMAGDGTNDVGALKQAHVGVALLENKQPPKKEENNQAEQPIHKKSDVIKQLTKVDPTFNPQTQKKKTFMELLKEMKEKQEQLAQQEEAQLVKLGDASIASPFTSKKSTIESCAHIIMQGRCTLVTTMQMYKILALNCLVSAYSLSALYLDGVKFGDSQMMINGVGIAMCFLFISRSKPLDTLSKERPHTSIFSPYMLSTVLGQFFIHITTLVLSVQAAKLAAPDVILEPIEGDFKPNLLNTIVFIVTSLQTVVTFANNYKGRPFMQGLTENRPLLFILLGIGALCMLCASGLAPEVNEAMELVDIPEGVTIYHHFSFRTFFLTILTSNIIGVFIVEKMCQYFFPAEDKTDAI